MFENFSFREFTWSREPVLILALVIAVLQIVAAMLVGDVELINGIESIVTLIFGFIARGQVTPV